MDNEADWVFIENENKLVVELGTTLICEKTDEEDFNNKNKPSYVAALLKNVQQNDHRRQGTVSSIVQRKEKPISKQNNERKLTISYIESKPGSQYRNPRDKAGKNKVHNGRRKSESPPKNIGNSSKIGCSFCNPKLSNRVERSRHVRQQCSAANWKDYDY